MLQLPEEPILICHKCLTQVVTRCYPLICPKCGLEEKTTQTKVERLVKFYPRLLDARESLAALGFKWDTYTFIKHSMIRTYYFETLKFHCAECDKIFSVPVSRAAKFAKEPGLFCCSKCRKHPKLNKVTKEFFVSFDNVDMAAHSFVKFQFDLFLPLGLNHSDFDLQAPIYRQEAKQGHSLSQAE